ncbi:MAG TPA: hypothetical protein VM487_23870 [Phycisphaerae bacterium]|nr:hypothetical protein [Phycisphaerae bacterium]
MTESTAALRRAGTRHTALWVAFASVAVWFAALLWINPQPIADERMHWQVITGLLQGRWPHPGQIPMFPAFHLIGAGAARLLGESLLVVRLLNALITLAALVLVYSAARVRHSEAAGGVLLLWAWNPLYLPYCVLAYTEPASLLALAGALWFHVRKRTLWAAVALLAACFVRQSNIVWIAFFAAWGLAHELDAARTDHAPRSATGLAALNRTALRRLWPYAVAIGLFGAFSIVNRSWVWVPSGANRPGVNAAQFRLFGFVVAVLWAPLWIQWAREIWSRKLGPALTRAWVCAALIAAVAGLGMGFDNPHPWNANPNYLHDRFLVLLYTSGMVRYVVAALIVAGVLLLADHVWSGSDRYTLLAVWGFSLLFLLPHWLVDHRYYILPIMFIHFCTRYRPRQVRPLCAWSLVLSVLTAGYVALYGGPYSGL